MSYEEEKQDRKIEQLEAEIERLRGDNAGLSKAVIDIQEERDLAQAEFRAYHKAWEEGAAWIKELEAQLALTTSALENATRKPDVIDATGTGNLDFSDTNIVDDLIKNGNSLRARVQKAELRIKELEDALAEYQRLGKTIAGKVPCLTLHGDCGRCSAKMREVCGALEQIAGGKIGPDVKPQSWQITEERKAALERLIVPVEILLVDHGTDPEIENAVRLLRAMLEEVGQ